MDWLGERELRRMLKARIQRYKERCKPGSELEPAKWDNRASWYALGFRDAWEIVNSLECKRPVETNQNEEKEVA